MFRKRKLAALPKIALIAPHEWPGGFPRQNPNPQYSELRVLLPMSSRPETIIVPVAAPREQACDC